MSEFVEICSPEINHLLRIKLSIDAEIFDQLKQDTLQHIIMLLENIDRIKIPFEGRSIYFPAEEQIRSQAHNEVFQLLKFKGVTHKGSRPIMQPYDDEKDGISNFRQARENIICDHKGRFKSEKAPNQPMGTLRLRDAENEFKITKKLFKACGNTPLPIGTGEYLNMQFEGEGTGFIILGINSYINVNGAKRDLRIGYKAMELLQIALEKKSMFEFAKAFEQINLLVEMAANALLQMHKRALFTARRTWQTLA